MSPPTSRSIPWSSSTLCLCLSYRLDSAAVAQQLRSRDHQQCADSAAVSSGLLPQGTRVLARATDTVGAVTVATVQRLPIPGDTSHHLRLDFLYGACDVAVRCLVELPQCDGVTAIRFTLATLERLYGVATEEETQKSAAAFKRMPPLRYTWRHALRFFLRAVDLLPRVLWSWLAASVVGAPELACPTTPAGMFAYYRLLSPPPPGKLRCYAPSGKSGAGSAFKAMVAALEAWRARPPTRRAFYTLVNQPPNVFASIVPTVAGVMDMQARYEGALLPPAPPPHGPVWMLLSHVHAEHVFVNNYGKHTQAGLPPGVATGFLWDWVGMPAPVSGIGCITVNDAFLAWRRGTAADLDTSEALFTPALGQPVLETTQLIMR